MTMSFANSRQAFRPQSVGGGGHVGLPLGQFLCGAGHRVAAILGACHDEYRHLATDKPVADVFGFIQRSPA